MLASTHTGAEAERYGLPPRLKGRLIFFRFTGSWPKRNPEDASFTKLFARRALPQLAIFIVDFHPAPVLLRAGCNSSVLFSVSSPFVVRTKTCFLVVHFYDDIKLIRQDGRRTHRHRQTITANVFTV